MFPNVKSRANLIGFANTIRDCKISIDQLIKVSKNPPMMSDNDEKEIK